MKFTMATFLGILVLSFSDFSNAANSKCASALGLLASRSIFHMREMIGLPWKISSELDSNIRVLTNNGKIEEASNLLLAHYLELLPEARSTERASRVQKVRYIEKSLGFDLSSERRLYLMHYDAFDDQIVLDGLLPTLDSLTKTHEGRHFIGANPKLWKVKMLYALWGQLLAPAFPLIHGQICFAQERVAIGAE